MALNTHLGFLFKATDQASGVMRRITLGLNQLRTGGDLVSKAMAGVSLSFAGNALINFAERGTKAMLGAAEASGKFTQELAAARGVIAGATAADMDRIGEAAKRLGMKYGVSAQMVAAGATEMGRAGRTPTEIIQLLEPTLRFASSAQMGFDDASRVLMSTMTAFQIPFKEASATVDQFANILNTTQASGADIQTTFAKAASIAGAFDQNIDEALVMMGVLKQLGFDASSTSTNMRQAISRIYSMPSVINKVKELGVALFDPVTGNRRPWHDVAFDLADVHAGMEKNAASISQYQIYGARGIGQDIAALRNTVKILKDGKEIVLTGREAFEEMLNEQKKRGTAKRLSDLLMDTFEGQRTRLKATVQNLKIDIGKGFEEVFHPALQVINDLLEGLEGFMSSIGPAGRRAIAILAMMEVAVVGLTGAVMALLGSIVLAKLVLPIIAPMLAPVLVIMTAILVITGSLTIAYQALRGETSKTGTFLDYLAASFARVKLFAHGLWQLLTKGKITGTPLAELLKKENAGILDTLGTWWQRIKRTQAAFEGFVAGLRSHLENPAVKAALESLKDSIGGLMENLGLGSKGLDKLDSSMDDARETGRSWGAVLYVVTLAVIGLADAMVRIADVAVSMKPILDVMVMVMTSEFGQLLFILVGVLVAFKAIRSAIIGIRALKAMDWATSKGAAVGRFFESANSLRMQGGSQVLSSSGSVVAQMAPGIGRQILNLTGISAIGQLATGVLGKFKLTANLATTLAGNVGKLNLGTAGFVAAAAGMGYLVGTMLDDWLGISDSISKWFYDAPKIESKDAAVYLREVHSRAAPAFLAPGQATAANTLAGGKQVAGAMVNGVKISPESIAALAKITNQPVSVVAQWDGATIAELLVKHQRANSASSFNAEDTD